MTSKPILGPCDSYQLAPFAYEWAWNMYKDCRKNEWTPQEIGMGNDVADYKSPDLDPKHRHLFMSMMAQLTTFDIERGDDAAETFLQIIQPAEMKQFLKRLIFEEAGHTESYRYCIENMGIPEVGPDNIYDTWKHVPIMMQRIEYAQSFSDKLMRLYAEQPDSFEFRQHFLRTAIYWFLIFEGVWFWMGLLGPIQQLARLGVFKNTAEQFTLIARDEAQHIRFGVNLIKEFIAQYPETVNQETLQLIYSDTMKAVDMETDFISYCLKDGPIMGYSAPDHVETTKYFANMRMRSIGLQNIYDDAQHRFPWMAEQMETKKEKNFFETRVTDYQIGGVLEFEDHDDQFESVM
jgi:ribonucleoside-diphosphate reductase beta chain